MTLTKGLIIGPESADIYLSRGSVYLEQKNYQRAREDLQKAAELYQQQNNTEMYKTALEKLKEIQ